MFVLDNLSYHPPAPFFFFLNKPLLPCLMFPLFFLSVEYCLFHLLVLLLTWPVLISGSWTCIINCNKKMKIYIFFLVLSHTHEKREGGLGVPGATASAAAVTAGLCAQTPGSAALLGTRFWAAARWAGPQRAATAWQAPEGAAADAAGWQIGRGARTSAVRKNSVRKSKKNNNKKKVKIQKNNKVDVKKRLKGHTSQFDKYLFDYLLLGLVISGGKKRSPQKRCTNKSF